MVEGFINSPLITVQNLRPEAKAVPTIFPALVLAAVNDFPFSIASRTKLR